MVAYLPEYKEPTEDELYEASVVIRRRMDLFDVCELFDYARRPIAGVLQGFLSYAGAQCAHFD